MSRTTEDPLEILYIRSLGDWPDLCRYQPMKVFPSPCRRLWMNLQEMEAGCSWVRSRERGVLVFTTMCLQKPPTLSLFSYVLLVSTSTKMIFPCGNYLRFLDDNCTCSMLVKTPAYIT